MWTLTTVLSAVTSLFVSNSASAIPAIPSPANEAIRTSVQVTVDAAARDRDKTESLPYNRIPENLLDSNSSLDRIAALISSNEGKPDSIVWNDNGAGMSVGLFQANQKVGELPQLLERLAQRADGRADIISAFGERRGKQLISNPEMIRRLKFSPKNAWGKGMKRLATSPTFLREQVDMLREKITRAAEIGAHHEIDSTAGVALVADLINQWGEKGAHRFLPLNQSLSADEAIAVKIVERLESDTRYGARYRANLYKSVANGLSFEETFAIDD